ncbi:MAG: T9SS type A sorting domain-containing protein, partial [Bacteroidota bacterium]
PRFEDLLVPDRGRRGTITTLDSIKLFGKVRNIGQDTLFDYDIYFSLDNGSPVFVPIDQLIAPGDSLLLDFGSSADCSTPGTHTFNAWIEVEEDGQTYLDTLESPVEVVQLDNPELTFPFVVDFEQAVGKTYTANRLGIDGLDFLDYNTNGTSNLSFSNGSLHLASEEDDGSLNIDNEVIMTLNVGRRTEDANKHVLLNFQFASEVDEDAPLSNGLVDTIWARGVDTDEWVYVASLDGNTSWSTVEGLDITAAITAAGQSHSSSTQVRFQQRSSRGLVLGSMNAEFNVPLPVELSLFEATKQLENVLLNWQTIEEINSDYFEIEVAIGEDQMAAANFQSLSRVEAVGNSVDTQDYYFLDEIIHILGNRYYRLKIVDQDGSFEYSPLRVVYFEEKDLATMVYPNPFKDEIYLQLSERTAQNIRLELWDIRGVRLRSEEVSYQPGQLIKLPESTQLAPGAYILNVWSGYRREQFRILKQ